MYISGLNSFSRIDQELISTGAATRLLLASALGGAIGLERASRRKASGMRTNLLICLGSAFFTMLSVAIAGDGSANKGQIASNIVQGIGFLGAGLILHTGSRVLGLTSAATVWVVASIGMACGGGLYLPAILATLIVLVALHFIGFVEVRLDWQPYPLVYEVRGHDENEMFRAVLSVLDRARLRLTVSNRDSFGAMERIVFVINATRKTHERLLAELTASAGTDQVLALRDSEEE
ncbi:MAG: MgtC/SapB family protein [Acidobacteriota bacterium]|nr:MgtC/SapB family protein [Acidobacteriota bacterium]